MLLLWGESITLKSKIVAIHQPNFFPWLGFFNKIWRCDSFILLDEAQFPQTGHGTYVNRTKVLINNQPCWITAPIRRNLGIARPIKDIIFNEDSKWREKILKTISMSYKRAKFYDEGFAFIEPLLLNRSISLFEYNYSLIYNLASIWGASHKIVLGSSLQAEGKSTSLLISLTKAVGGTAYMCGSGGKNYQDESMFSDSNICLIHQNFCHPIYQQNSKGAFCAGLSVIDTMMNLGINGLRDIFKSIE